MTTDIEHGARTLGEETAGSRLVQASHPDQDPGGDAVQERVRSSQKGRSVFEQFMRNLIPALGAWPN